jgi:ribA/ribD-fused uncharacterized protein
MTTTREDERQVRQNAVYFFGQNNKYGEFSNWFPCRFSDGQIIFSNTEQYMMYHKALLFKDKTMADMILKTSSPKLCKQYGRRVENFNNDVWLENCERIVTNGCYLKFSQNEELKQLLLSTGNKMLVEDSPYDKIWGIGMQHTEACKTPMEHWKGENKLGKCLMEVRNSI